MKLQRDLMRIQDGRCAMCCLSFAYLKRLGKNRGEPVIDHDHETDAVRGLVCRSCNTHLGRYELLHHFDSFDVYSHIVRYLKIPEEIWKAEITKQSIEQFNAVLHEWTSLLGGNGLVTF
jgi:hypothetical protein